MREFSDGAEAAIWREFFCAAIASGTYQGDTKQAAKEADRMLEEFLQREPAPEQAES